MRIALVTLISFVGGAVAWELFQQWRIRIARRRWNRRVKSKL